MRENEKAHQLLIKKASQVQAAAEIITETIRDVQIIHQYLNNHKQLELTEVQEKKLKRYKFIYDLRAAGTSTTQIVSQLTNRHTYNLSVAQAYEDIRCSKELYVSVIHIDKNFELKLELEVNRIARSKAMELQLHKEAAYYGKLIKEIIIALPDEEQNPGEYFQGYNTDAVFDPRLLGAPEITTADMKALLNSINEKRKKKIDLDIFEDIDHEEVKDGE
jgi:hypothetical protein